MRKCIRCETVMVENLTVGVTGSAQRVCVKKGVLRNTLSEVTAAVCPQCGYLETYVDDVSAIQRLTKENKK